MKNTVFSKILAASATIAFAAGFAVPASAEMTTGVFYDQFGNAHSYQVAAPSNYYGNSNNFYGNSTVGYNQYNYGLNRVNRQPNIWSLPNTVATDGIVYLTSVNAYDPDNDPLSFALINGPTGMTVNPTSGQIRWDGTTGQSGKTIPVTIAVSDGRNAPVNQSFTISMRGGNTTGSLTNGGTKTTTGTNSGSGAYQGSAIGSIFGASKNKNVALAINNLTVTSGPTNIYANESNKNCSVNVSWTTTLPAVGQVVYGPTSQSNVKSFSYPSSVTPGTSYQKTHQVTLGCLENTTYYLRVIAFSDTDRTVSAEQTIFPIKILTAVPSVSGTSSSESGSASALATIGRMLTSPIALLLVLAAGIYFVVTRLLRKGSGGASAEHGSVPTEPALQIPHH